MQKILLFIIAATVYTLATAQPVIVSKGQIALSAAPATYGLGGTYSMSVHNLIYSNDLSFIGRQLSDNSYLHINVNEQTVKSVELKNAFFIFRGSSNPVQFLYPKSPVKIANIPNYSQVFYYNFQTQRLAGAVAYQSKVSGPVTLRGDHSNVIDLDGKNNTLLLHWLDVEKEDHFVGVPLVPPVNDMRDSLLLQDYPLTAWQIVDYNVANPAIKFTIPSTAKYTSPSSVSMDMNREVMRINSTTTMYWDLKEGKPFTYKADHIKGGVLKPGGKLAVAMNEKVTVKGKEVYVTVIKIVDFRTGKEEKKITLPDNRTYEVFFSQGKYAVYYDKYPDAQKLTPYLIDLETEAISEIPFINPLENMFQGKKKFKGNLTELKVAADIIYSIKDVLFSHDLKRMVITSYMDLGRAEKIVAYTVGGKRVYLENFIDVFEIK